jgi:hypothetical protein
MTPSSEFREVIGKEGAVLVAVAVQSPKSPS